MNWRETRRLQRESFQSGLTKLTEIDAKEQAAKTVFVAIVHGTDKLNLDVQPFSSEEEACKFVELHRDQPGNWYGSQFRCRLSSGLPNGRVMGEIFTRRIAKKVEDTI